jgi:hypothetical protein
VYALFLALGAAAGCGGYAAATAMGWEPTETFLLRGIVYGAFGQAVARVHLQRIPGGEATEALTVLSATGDWLAGVLDVHIPGAVRRHLAKLPPEQLAQYVDHLFRLKVVGDASFKGSRKKFATTVNDATRDLLEEDPVARLQASSSLRALGEDWVLKYKFSPPEPV